MLGHFSSPSSVFQFWYKQLLMTTNIACLTLAFMIQIYIQMDEYTLNDLGRPDV